MGKDYRKAVTGSSVQPAGMQFQAGAPLDDRMVVNNKESLIHQCLADATGGVQWLYNGQITCDKETGDIYVLMDKSKLTLFSTDDLNKLTTTEIDSYIKNAWTKIPSQTDLETNKKDLFSFQGVASAIDADHCTLTIGDAKDIDNNSLSVTEQVADVEGRLFYHWVSKNCDYWTLGPIREGVYTYTLTKQENTKQFTYKGDVYYQASAGQTNNKTPYMNTDGDTFWVDADNKLYLTASSDTSIGSIDSTMTAKDVYFATQSESTLTAEEVKGASAQLQASDGTNVSDGKDGYKPSNKGHVYQLGEEEYASNGTIWVQLGSPKEDWIVIK